MKLTNLYFRIKSKLFREIGKIFNYRPNSYPFVSGDGFRNIADFVYDEIKNFNPKDVKNGDIIFVASPFIKEYFTKIHIQINQPYKLITHNGDNEVGEFESKYIDDKIIHWFAQNNTFKHPKITPIPIGIENKKWFMSGYVLTKIIKKLEGQRNERKRRILFGFNSNTNFEERSKALAELRKNPLADEIKERLIPTEYFKLLNKYDFVASPPGNGVDCHRTWEALYLDITPLVKDSYCMRYFKEINIPTLIVSSYNNLPEEEIRQEDKKSSAIYMDYWINKINNG